AVVWAEENNIVYGVSADKFAPEKNISREDTAAIIYRYMGISADTNAKTFADSASISGYAKEAVGTLSSKGIINGYPDNSFKPKNTITRAETASILYNIAE
ncbi:MAG: S-layer homology domain-containing protein, partial [Firmicutes bacterium]|nr:S-layer homology domain-containing protein [Bacillota bacterium]